MFNVNICAEYLCKSTAAHTGAVNRMDFIAEAPNQNGVHIHHSWVTQAAFVTK